MSAGSQGFARLGFRWREDSGRFPVVFLLFTTVLLGASLAGAADLPSVDYQIVTRLANTTDPPAAGRFAREPASSVQTNCRATRGARVR